MAATPTADATLFDGLRMITSNKTGRLSTITDPTAASFRVTATTTTDATAADTTDATAATTDATAAVPLQLASSNSRPGGDDQTGLILESRPETKKPAMFKVFLLNDDYTPMEFVVHVLERFFAKNRDEATKIMLLVHQKGIGLCGVYTYEIAETKVAQVIAFARRHQHPLQCTVEKD